MSLKQKLTVLVSAGATAIALTVIAHFEGVRYEPYEDVGGVLTVCYGLREKTLSPIKFTQKKNATNCLRLTFSEQSCRSINWLRCQLTSTPKLHCIHSHSMLVPAHLLSRRCLKS